MNIQWYPGHMTKTRRQMQEHLKNIDIVCEVVDARIPQVSRNPDMDQIAGDKPRMIILNRIDLADPNMTKKWAAWYRAKGYAVIETDSQHGTGTNAFSAVYMVGLKVSLRILLWMCQCRISTVPV